MRRLLIGTKVLNYASRRAHVRTFASSTQSRFFFDGPIEWTAQLIRSFHELSGLTYGITIPLTAIVLRTAVTLPLSIYSQNKLIRRIELRPLFFVWGEVIGQAAVKKVKQDGSQSAALKGNREGHEMAKKIVQKALSRKMKAIYQRHGCSTFRIVLPTFVQIPIFILVSLALRSMTGWTTWSDIGMTVPMEPLLLSQGFGSIQDLTQPDGSFILPVMIGLLSITNVELTAARRIITLGKSPFPAPISRIFFLTLSALMIPVAMQAPAALCLYWVASASYSLIQNILMHKFLPTPPPYIHPGTLGLQRRNALDSESP